jgi:hypothetical protein
MQGQPGQAVPVVRDARRTRVLPQHQGSPKVQEHFVKPIKAMIEENPSFGYRTVAHLLGFNKNTVQRIVPAQGLAGAQAPGGLQASHPGFAFGGQGARRALGHRSVPRVDRA